MKGIILTLAIIITAGFVNGQDLVVHGDFYNNSEPVECTLSVVNPDTKEKTIVANGTYETGYELELYGVGLTYIAEFVTADGNQRNTLYITIDKKSIEPLDITFDKDTTKIWNDTGVLFYGFDGYVFAIVE